MTELAIYDMDRTITRTGTYTPFLLHVALRRAPWRLVLTPLVGLMMLAYGLKLISRGLLKEVNQTLLLGSHITPAELAPLTASFAEKTLAYNVHPGALAQIAADRAAGRRLVMATASYRLYAQEIGTILGFDDVIATNTFADIDQRIRAKIEGENCYGPAKLRMILAWLAQHDLDRQDLRVRFYSDHASDAPVLEWADEPFAVNPHSRLRRLARARGWRTLDWRHTAASA